MNDLLIACAAATAMFFTDLVATVMVQAEAANRGWLAGFMDSIGWYFGIITTTISVSALAGNDLSAKIEVLVLVGAANLFGTKCGQMTGHWILTRKQQPDGRSRPAAS